jgi:peptide/nickel transport system substrate-binding protein
MNITRRVFAEITGVGVPGSLLLRQSAAAEILAHRLNFCDGYNVTTLNPALSAQTSVGLLSQLTMAYLVRYDQRNRPIPELAEAIPTRSNGGISLDGKTITWRLRRDAKWSDGMPFDSADVAFSVEAMQNPANNIVSHDGFALIDRVDIPDRYRVVFHLKEPYAAYLPRFFGSPPGNPCILPRHILGGLHDINEATYNALPVGIGPFRYVAWNRNDSIEMEANPFYFRGLPRLRNVVYKIITEDNTSLNELQTGELDMLVNVKPINLPRIGTMPGVNVLKGPGYRFINLNFNMSHPVMQDRAVRRALRLATDRQSLFRDVFHGTGVLQESFVPPQYVGYDPLPFVPFDLAQANLTLEKAGWKLGAEGIRAKGEQKLSIELATVTGVYSDLVELLRSWWTQVGVDLHTRTYDSTLFYQPHNGVLFGGKFDATIISIQNFPFVYPSLIYGCDRIPPKGLNVPHYCNPKLDTIMRDYESTYDEPQQEKYLSEISQIIDEDIPTFVLEYADNVFAFNKGVQNFRPNAVTFFDAIMNVDA